MNTNQYKALEIIKRCMLERNSHGAINYEIKSIESNDLGQVLSVAVSIGLVDETESARAFLREHRHFFIGKRGGVTLVSVDAFNKFESVNERIKGLDNAVAYLPRA